MLVFNERQKRLAITKQDVSVIGRGWVENEEFYFFIVLI